MLAKLKIHIFTFSAVVALWPLSPTVAAIPDTFAELGHQAHHPIVFSKNKLGQISFQIDNQSIALPLATDSATTKSNNTRSNFIHQSFTNGHLSATQGENSLFGQLSLNDKNYILTTNQNGIWAVELPDSGISYNSCGTNHDSQPFDQNKNMEVLSHTKNKSAGTIIDVLIIYDQAIADRYPGELLQTRVDQYFNVSNQTYANSEIDLAIRQVGLEQVGYDFDDANINARNLIQQALNIGVGASGFENVPQLRAQSGADLVIFLRTHSIETRGNCGIAFFPVPTGNNTFDSSYGVNIMADGMSSWSICTDQLMVHEIGHNLGAGHHNVTVQQRFIPDAAGFAKLGQYGTAMGSFGTGQVDRFLELDYFSNPTVQCGGDACGVFGDRNNANVINQLKGRVANYQTAVSNAPNPDDFSLLAIDQDGDGVLDRDDEFPFDAAETTDSDGDGVGDNGDAFANNFNEQLDTDNDGIGNNSDNDDDNDGILDRDDDFPLNPNEVKDSDADGVGDIADVFIFESSEYQDTDGDGIGNNADTDDDNDTVIDIDIEKQDLLVINVGNNRILRFDAQTGLAKGIEVLPSDGLLTFQSDLDYDSFSNRLYYSSQSTIKSADLLNREAPSIDVILPYSDTQAELGSGFPSALLVVDNSKELIVGKTNSIFDQNAMLFDLMRDYEFNYVGGATASNNRLIDDPNEWILDLNQAGNNLYALGLNASVYKGHINADFMAVLGSRNKAWLVDPYAFVVTDENILIHTDQSRNKLVMTDGNDGSFQGIFADIAELGYSNPTGIEMTNDARLLVAVSDQNKILQFNATTGEFIGELVSGFGLDQPHKMVLVPQLKDRFHQDADKVMRPNAGNWFNPASSGRGFNVGIFNNRLQVLWFTYDEEGLPIWYQTAGLLDGFTYTAEILRTRQIDDSNIDFTVIGDLRIAFENERQATYFWQIGEDSGQEDIQWFQFSGEPEVNNYTGMWSRPDAPGWGLAISTVGEVSVSIPFIYDDNGDPRWSISDALTGAQPFDFNMVSVFSDTLCPTCSGEPITNNAESGTMRLNLSNDASWNSAIEWADPIPGSWYLEDTEIIRISSPPSRPR